MPKLPPVVTDKVVIQSRPVGLPDEGFDHLWTDVFLPVRSMAGRGWEVWLHTLRNSTLEHRRGLEYRAVHRIVREGVMPDPPPLEEMVPPVQQRQADEVDELRSRHAAERAVDDVVHAHMGGTLTACGLDTAFLGSDGATTIHEEATCGACQKALTPVVRR
jgi:hypothetical protein